MCKVSMGWRVAGAGLSEGREAGGRQGLGLRGRAGPLEERGRATGDAPGGGALSWTQGSGSGPLG